MGHVQGLPKQPPSTAQHIKATATETQASDKDNSNLLENSRDNQDLSIMKSRPWKVQSFEGDDNFLDPSIDQSELSSSFRPVMQGKIMPILITSMPKADSCYLGGVARTKQLDDSPGSRSNMADSNQQDKIVWGKPKLRELSESQFLTIDKFTHGGVGEYWAGCRGSKLVRIDSQGLRVHESIAGESHESIVEVVALSSHVCLIRNKFIVDVVKYTGDFEFQLSLKSYFDEEDEYITSCLGHRTSDYLLLASNVGMLLVVQVNFEEKSANVLHFEREHLRRISAVLWLNEAANEFITASNDKHINKYRIEREGCRQTARFAYDQPIMKCLVSHDFIVVAFAPGWVSIVEPIKGTPLVTMGDDQCRVRKMRLENARVNWIGCLHTLGKEEAAELSRRALDSRPDFLKYLVQLRILLKSDEPSLHVITYPQSHPDNRSLRMFRDPLFSNNKYNPRIPVMIEQITPGTLALRAFAGTYHDPQRDRMWMSEVLVSLQSVNLDS